jgi:hypothetical protein
MALYIRVDDETDLAWFLNLIQNSLANPNSPRLQASYVNLMNWDRYLRNPVKMKEVVATVANVEEILAPAHLAAQKKAEVAAKRKLMERKRKGSSKSTKKKKEPEQDPYSCSHHPTYHGQRSPQRDDCEECWELYAIRNGHAKAKHAREKLRRRLATSQ